MYAFAPEQHCLLALSADVWRRRELAKRRGLGFNEETASERFPLDLAERFPGEVTIVPFIRRGGRGSAHSCSDNGGIDEETRDLKWATTSDQIGVGKLQQIRSTAVARHKCIGIRQTLTTLLPKAEIERLAHESGAVRRRRKVDASAMLWTVCCWDSEPDASARWPVFGAPTNG